MITMIDDSGMEALAKKAREDKQFCVVCMEVKDCPVVANCCYHCGGGEETLN